jgi:hypothetical protein
MCEHARWCIDWKQKVPRCLELATNAEWAEIRVGLKHANSGQVLGVFTIMPKEPTSIIVDRDIASRLGVAELPSLPKLRYNDREYFYVWIDSVTTGELSTQSFVKVLFPVSTSSLRQQLIIGSEYLHLFNTTSTKERVIICERANTMPMFLKFTDLLPFTLIVTVWFLWAVYQTKSTMAWTFILAINVAFRAPWLYSEQTKQTLQEFSGHAATVIKTFGNK